MELRFQAGGPESWSADAVIVFLSEDEKLEKAYPELLDAAPWMSIAPGMRDFHGKKGEMGLLYGPPAHPLSRAVVVGLGKLDALTYAETLEEIRKGAGAAAVRCRELGVDTLALPVSGLARFNADVERTIEEIVCAAMLGLWRNKAFKSKEPEDADPRWLALLFCDANVPDFPRLAARRGETHAEAVILARNLANTPANSLTPEDMAEEARKLARRHDMNCEVLEREDIVSLGMGAFAAVAAGSANDPRLIILEHSPAGHADEAPLIVVGKGITFRPKNKWFELTMRFRMQNLLSLSFDDDFTLTKTDARVKRLRLRFDGYIYSPKLVYSVQLGFTGYDTEVLPNGNMNIVRDAIVYYVPSAKWNIGFGQTKIKANRARINSSSALQFVDRSIVNSEFNLDRDFGFFGEYNLDRKSGFDLSAKGSVTLGEGRNWGSSSNGGMAYTGRLELYPLGRFSAKGDLLEGDFDFEERPRILIAGAYSYNHKASRLKGQRGGIMPDDATRDIGSYFADFILKYRGFAFYTDYMGRTCDEPLFDSDRNAFVYSGQGLNIQASYLFRNKWEVALRNSTLFPEEKVQPLAGYRNWNQTTLGVTRYIIGHSLKVQADMSYNTRSRSADPNYNRWEIRFQLELGL